MSDSCHHHLEFGVLPAESVVVTPDDVISFTDLFFCLEFVSYQLSLLPAGAVIPGVLLHLCFPDAKLLIAGPFGPTSPPDFPDSRVPARGRLTLCSHLCLSYKGYQGRAATSGPETGCSDKLPLNWFVSGLSWPVQTTNLAELLSGLFRATLCLYC